MTTDPDPIDTKPERVWLRSGDWATDPKWEEYGFTPYVRADLHEGLRAENERLTKRVLALEDEAPKTNAVDCYEREFYPLSNFSAFSLKWNGCQWPTSEHAYQGEKFIMWPVLRRKILHAASAHDAFKLAEVLAHYRRPDWNLVKVAIMRDILRAKANQHEYVRRKLIETGEREIIEMSWRDDFWGWGPNHDGQNMLGKLWMEIRADIKGTDQ